MASNVLLDARDRPAAVKSLLSAPGGKIPRCRIADQIAEASKGLFDRFLNRSTTLYQTESPVSRAGERWIIRDLDLR